MIFDNVGLSKMRLRVPARNEMVHPSRASWSDQGWSTCWRSPAVELCQPCHKSLRHSFEMCVIKTHRFSHGAKMSKAHTFPSCLEGQIAADVAESSFGSRLADRIQDIFALNRAEAFLIFTVSATTRSNKLISGWWTSSHTWNFQKITFHVVAL